MNRNTLIVGLVVLWGMVLVAGAGALAPTTFDSPLPYPPPGPYRSIQATPTPKTKAPSAPIESGPIVSVFYLPLVLNGSDVPYGPTPTPTPVATWPAITPCADPVRGPLYRDMVSNTADILGPVAAWAGQSCCMLDAARTNGRYVGRVLGLVRVIGLKVGTLIWRMVGQAGEFVVGLFGILPSAPTMYEITCEDEAEGICWGLAVIVALDEMAGGWITIIVGFVLAILTIFLALYVIREVRNILLGGAGGGDAD